VAGTHEIAGVRPSGFSGPVPALAWKGQGVAPGRPDLSPGDSISRQVSREELEAFLGKLQEAQVFDRRISFDIDDESGRIVVRVIDRATGEVIRQIPPDQVLAVAMSIEKMLGLLLDERL